MKKFRKTSGGYKGSMISNLLVEEFFWRRSGLYAKQGHGMVLKGEQGIQ